MPTKVAAIVFHIAKGNEDAARKKIKAIVESVIQDPTFGNVELDQKYGDPDYLLFDEE